MAGDAQAVMAPLDMLRQFQAAREIERPKANLARAWSDTVLLGRGWLEEKLTALMNLVAADQPADPLRYLAEKLGAKAKKSPAAPVCPPALDEPPPNAPPIVDPNWGLRMMSMRCPAVWDLLGMKTVKRPQYSFSAYSMPLRP